MDTNLNRVYINPNFNRVPNNPAIAKNPVYMTNYFHVNPNFTQHLPNVQANTNLNRRIYVNPNFIKTTSESKLETNNDNTQLGVSRSSNNDYVNTTSRLIENSKPPASAPLRPSCKSRYRLIRNNDCKLLETQRPQETCTVKISKYKSIPINNFKNNLQMTKHVSVAKHTHSKSNKFKFVRHDIVQTTSTPVKLPLKSNCLKIKRNIDLNLQIKLKVPSGMRKKNNIPCRLFTKYGKCLRNVYGTCDYLHERKHVSLCRKFIKGICHDKGCLLSHELSSKKMPTCYFYLKGRCMKEDCPYLHVKLSEKSKVCLDFLKGYCDKGDMCVHRHVTPHPNKCTNSKRLVNTFNKHKLNKTVKLNITKSIKINQSRRLNAQVVCKKLDKQHPSNSKNEQNKEDGDCRYFKEDLRKEDVTVLKPTRCKLGILPSFIQL